MHPATPYSAKILFPLAAMLAVLTTSSMAVTVIAVLAPAAAPEIGVDATRIGDYTAIVYLFATLSGAVTGALVGRFGAIRVCQITMLLAALAMLAFTRGTLTWVLVSGVIDLPGDGARRQLPWLERRHAVGSGYSCPGGPRGGGDGGNAGGDVRRHHGFSAPVRASRDTHARLYRRLRGGGGARRRRRIADGKTAASLNALAL
jgi:MFS family permease